MVAHSHTVLLVDDEPVFNFITESLLKRVNLVKEVYSVFNGREAMKLLQESFQGLHNIPSHIFLDLNMPIMNGFSFLEEFSKLPRDQKDDIKIIVVSSSENPSDIAKVKSYGVEDYISKPLSPDTLKEILQ
jgi:CheY-like chemotaxis protein